MRDGRVADTCVHARAFHSSLHAQAEESTHTDIKTQDAPSVAPCGKMTPPAATDPRTTTYHPSIRGEAPFLRSFLLALRYTSAQSCLWLLFVRESVRLVVCI